MTGPQNDSAVPRLTVQQILAFEADCREHNMQRRAEMASTRLGIKARSYVPMLVALRQDPDRLRRALELDPITTNRMLDRLERAYNARERIAGRATR